MKRVVVRKVWDGRGKFKFETDNYNSEVEDEIEYVVRNAVRTMVYKDYTIEWANKRFWVVRCNVCEPHKNDFGS
jgi:hypothetical protein